MLKEPVNRRTNRGETLAIQSVTELVYLRLRSEIIDGSARQALPLNEIALEMGVSTTPVRVAIERLAAEGLVVQVSRRGARVAPLSPEDFRDIYAVRRGLEGTAANLGTAAMTDRDRETMTALAQALDAIASRSKPAVSEYLDAEWAIHVVCYRAPGYTRLFDLIEAYRRQAERYFRIALVDDLNIHTDLDQQHRFVEACMARHPLRAESAAQRLIDWTVEKVGPILSAKQAALTA